ncbi:hypothetical protein HAX54_042728 [Datura stramonium]|uniref:Uncharacterized protein n=1 Tax=Datura stramonium TaxID=4076 RepID=A0ABS8W3L3_DATST|nr:hypothetical protein [Datura stramonium]
MAPKARKGEGVAYSSHENKRSRVGQDAPIEDASMPQQPPMCYGLCWVTEQEDTQWFKDHKESKYYHELFFDSDSLACEFPYIIDRIHTLGLDFVFNDLGECNLIMQIDEEVVDYRPWYDPKGLDMTKTKELEDIHGLVLSISEHKVHIDSVLNHLYGMQMLYLRMSRVIDEQLRQLNMDYPLIKHSRALCRVGTDLEEPFDDDRATDEE